MAEPAPERPEAVLARHGRSFHWAAALLPADAARDAAALYAFCRHVDDLSDAGTDPAAAGAALVRLRAELADGRGADPHAAAFLDLARRRAIPVAPALDLIDGALGDLSGPRLETVDALVAYAYRMAGTVGLMMCPLLGAHDPAARPFAVDLGIAMQLTNIARDVAEDARLGRRYLPAALLGTAPAPALLADPPPDLAARAHAAVLAVLDLADAYYRSADAGMAFLPPRVRLGILTAARVYEAIGTRIRRAGPERPWQRRAVVPARLKAWHTARAAATWAATAGARPPAHDAELHRPLAGLAGAGDGWRGATAAPAGAGI